MKTFKPSHKKSEDKVKVLVNIPKSKIEEMDSIARKYNVSRTELILQCIDFAIENIESE